MSAEPTGAPVELQPTLKTEARVGAILRHLLATYDDVVYRVHPSAMTVVTGGAAALKTGSERVMSPSTCPKRGGHLHRPVGQGVAHRGGGGADPQDRSPRAAILRHLLKTYDDVVYRAAPGAATVVQRAAAALPGGGAALVHVRPYPPPNLTAVA
jgi:hypothetical protein